jgi:hypothetical protein
LMRGGLNTPYRDLLSDSDDCVDGIVLSASFRLGMIRAGSACGGGHCPDQTRHSTMPT